MNDADFKNLGIALPHSDVIARWAELQVFANDSELQIDWDATRNLLVVSGTGLDESKLIDEVTAIVYPGNTALEFIWNVNWKTNVREGTFNYVLAIGADECESLSLLRSHKKIASRHIRDTLPVWKNVVLEHVYPLYVTDYSQGEPCLANDFRAALTVKGEIVYTPGDETYELYMTAKPFIDTHLINIFEEEGVVYPPTLEWA